MPDHDREQTFRAITEGLEEQLWVLEGRVDLPIILPQVPDKISREIFFDFSGTEGDGYIELRAIDLERTRQSVWWSQSEPVLFEFRASVIARGLFNAWLRSRDFVNQALDRITFLAGAPATLVSVGMLYNETQLEACRAGTRSTVDCTPGGIPTRNTQPLRNAHIITHMKPSPRAKRALRWFRKALTFDDPEDQFLAFYVSLECISDDIQELTEKTHKCRHCGNDTGISRAHTDGIKELIARYPELPKGGKNDTFRIFGRTRGGLVHGGNDTPPKDLIKQLLPIVERLAADGIALSLSVDPASVQMTDFRAIDLGIIAQFDYDPTDNPHTRWGRSIRESLTELRRTQPPHVEA